jgi:hypothetical protein
MAGGADGILGSALQAAIDKFTRVVGKLDEALSSAGEGTAPPPPAPAAQPAPTIPAQSPGMQRGNAGVGDHPGGGFTAAGVAGTVAAGIGGAGSSGMLGGLARTALGYAPAPVAAAVTGLAAAGAAAQPAQMALNTLQYQSSIFGQSYDTTRVGAMGTAGTVLGGQMQRQWGLNPQDLAGAYASLQQTTAQVNPYSNTLGAPNIMGAMGGMSIANPAMSAVQNAQAVAQLYAPQTSLNMAMMGYGATPRQAGTGAAMGFADTMAPLLNRLGQGKPMSQQALQSQLAPGQKGYVDLANLTGGNPTEINQFANELSIQNALMTGVNGQPKMTKEQVDRVFAELSSGGKGFSAGEAVLQQYGISQSAIQMLKSKAGNQAESISDTQQGWLTGMRDMTRAISDFNTGLNKVINSVPGARGILGFGESLLSNIIGGGNATMYDSTVPDDAPKSPLPGTSPPLMIAYYVSAFAAPTKSKFPSGTQFVTIDQRGNHPEADVVDMESGAVYPGSAVNAWLKKAGGTKVVYATSSNKALLDATNPPKYSWWQAAWNGAQSVGAGAVAHQFASTSTYDTSVVSDPGAFNGTPGGGGGGGSPAATPASGGGTSTTTVSSFTPSSPGGLAAGLGDTQTEGSTEELAAFNAAIIGGALGGGGGYGSTSTTTTTAGTPGGTPAAAPAGSPAAGGKTMYDSQYPSVFPSNADLVVSYVDGPQASNFGAAQSKFGSKALSITWTGQNADIADAETSFPLTNMQAWIKAQNARGIKKPVVYAIYSGVGTNYAQVKQAVGTMDVSYWLSDWTGKPHTLPGADAVQYGAQASPSSPMITDPSKAGGHTYDLSFVSPSFPYYGGAPKITLTQHRATGQDVPKFTYTPVIPSAAGITIHFPAGSITASDPAAAATKAVAQLRAELVRLNLVRS